MLPNDVDLRFRLLHLAADDACDAEVGHHEDELWRKMAYLLGQEFDAWENSAAILHCMSFVLDHVGLKTEADILLQMIDMEPEEIEERWDYGDPSPRGCGSAEED
jgi:hypothetical protein